MTDQQSSRFFPDKETYFNKVEGASSLLNRFKEEANVDVLGRVAAVLQDATGLETRVAREGDRDYFAGLLRVVNNYIQIHSDYAPYVRNIYMLIILNHPHVKYRRS